ncbi:hypothetical protein D9611_013094 [Ephemerocybe angulata]|uniref:DUF8021 domain-containing protein n=1 Tax=Ephemerocybe angulata TaxID=980116 RepID=A0A8H5BZK4_9AGAR|nr:hypothetical protein D9611_013094 [Tulosesus angulatus]
MLKQILVATALYLSSVSAECTYSSLQEFTKAYVTQQATGAFATTASSAAYTENFRPVNISSGVISRPLRIDFSRSTHDTTQCATYTEIIVTNPSHPYVIGTQLRFSSDGTTLTNINSVVTDAGDWLFNATGTLKWASVENWGTIPVEKRDTRAVIQAAADAYLDLFNDPSVKAPWGTPCARLEGGAYTGSGAPTDSCNVGVPSGVPLTNRRYVIDETVGEVDVFVDFGNNKIPDTHEFRIEGGKIRFVHTMTATGGA